MLEFDVAQSQLAAAGATPSTTQRLPLAQCRGRVLAQAVVATLDLPPADNSAMDGYAIRYADLTPEARFPIQQRCYAGETPEALLPGRTIRLFTGSIMPAGADTVVMQEDVTETEEEMIIKHAPVKGRHVRHRGEDVQCGSRIFEEGAHIGAPELALLASQGIDALDVYSGLSIGILTTGDELVAPGQTRGPEQIYNSNGPMLAAMAADMGSHNVKTVHAADTPAAIESAFEQLLSDCDLILTVGGVSVGEKDLVKPTIEGLGGTLDLWRVRMKPGRPVALAHIEGKPVVCLPGNPVSAYVVFALLVSPLIRRMQGRSSIFPAIQYGALATSRSFQEQREEFLRVQADYSGGALPALTPHHDQGSAIISSLAWAHGLARIPVGRSVGNGDHVAYYSFADWLV